jgi:hypothetical protein
MNKVWPEKEIQEIKDLFSLHQLDDRILATEQSLVLNSGDVGSVKPFVLICCILGVPLAVVIYYLLADHANPLIFWVLLIVVFLGIEVYKIVRVPDVLTFDFKEGYLKAEKSSAILKRFLPKDQTVSFKDLVAVALENKKISGDSSTSWKRLSVLDKLGHSIILAEYNGNYPENMLGDKVKALIEAIIRIEKNNI